MTRRQPLGRLRRAVWMAFGLIAAVALLGARSARADDGYRLWLRYDPVEPQWLARYRASATELVDTDAKASPAQAELMRGLTGLLGAAPRATDEVTQDGAIVLGTPGSSAVVKSLSLDLRPAGTEGYLLRTVTIQGHRATVIAASTDVGVLYGAFAFLRLLQTRAPIAHLDITSSPKISRRVLDHWDNLNGSIERGYAGDSFWRWESLPEYLSPRYTDYARACASIG
ncbi:MAG TPA: alpha-glucuronidase family glycosyl hydrolase, partial [Steroidobacteraceae bacterium]|nr:alpha-glucuronidase family glycosyl hydrolase [Steroidobacteraceae bacterium]